MAAHGVGTCLSLAAPGSPRRLGSPPPRLQHPQTPWILVPDPASALGRVIVRTRNSAEGGTVTREQVCCMGPCTPEPTRQPPLPSPVRKWRTCGQSRRQGRLAAAARASGPRPHRAHHPLLGPRPSRGARSPANGRPLSHAELSLLRAEMRVWTEYPDPRQRGGPSRRWPLQTVGRYSALKRKSRHSGYATGAPRGHCAQ